jgi:hypothetical protein
MRRRRPGGGPGRVGGWLRRYLPAEAAGTGTALLCAGVAHAAGGDLAAVALAGAWGENLGYYGTVGARDLRRALAARQGAAPGRARRVQGALGEVLRGLLLEFGPAEALDSVLVRPLAMGAAARVIPQVGVAVLVGKVAADLLFYVPTVLAYERRRRRRGRGSPGP